MTLKDFFKKNANIVISIVLLALVGLGVVFLTNEMSKGKNEQGIVNTGISAYSENELYKYKSQYIGDASNVSNLLNTLPLGDFKKEILLITEDKPYGINVNYDFTNTNIDLEEIKSLFHKNAIVMFVLIENLDNITFKTIQNNEEVKYQYSRNEIQKSFNDKLWEYSKDIKTFSSFIKKQLNFEVEKPKNLESAIIQAIKEQGKTYLKGEYLTEGHFILGEEKNDDTVKVYALASIAWFGFENNVFTMISGSGAIPTLIVFSVNQTGEYSLLEYKEADSGSEYDSSIKEMFPEEYYNRLPSAQKEYSNIAKQQETQARQYLKSIGREAQVSAAYVEKKLANINVEASNKLFTELTKNDSFLNNCPYWIGTREQIEDGNRYVYETQQSKTSDDYDLITFSKTDYDGTIVEEREYKIIENEPKLIN